MLGLPIAFAYPWVLSALILLPVIWWLLRLTPPKPQTEIFPPLAILARLITKEETPAKSPWWLTLLRLLLAAFVIFAMSGPVLNP
ncbi:MAG: BatA domain-containing protein, partial [Pseudomonadota bacterium]